MLKCVQCFQKTEIYQPLRVVTQASVSFNVKLSLLRQDN